MVWEIIDASIFEQKLSAQFCAKYNLKCDGADSVLIWRLLLDYSMGFLPKKHMSSLNWLKVILSCRAQWVVSTVKKSAYNIVPIERYNGHKFSWKFQKS